VPNIVYSGDGSNVETVIINGKLVMENREIRTFDYDRVLESAQKATERIVDKVGYSISPRWRVS